MQETTKPQVTRTVFDMSSYDEGEVSDVGPCDEEGENEKVQNSPETQSSGIPLEESCVSCLFFCLKLCFDM